MSNTTNNSRRVFTLAVRKGVAILTDTANPANGTRQFGQVGQLSLLTVLKAINNLLDRMPVVKFDIPVTLLLPEGMAFLGYKDNRDSWIATGKKKNGQVVAPEVIAELKKMNKSLISKGNNIQFFNQGRITRSPYYMSCSKKTWALMNTIVKADEKKTVNANEVVF